MTNDHSNLKFMIYLMLINISSSDCQPSINNGGLTSELLRAFYVLNESFLKYAIDLSLPYRLLMSELTFYDSRSIRELPHFIEWPF